MKLSCKILCTISCVSFSLCAMEQDKPSLCEMEQEKLSITNNSSQTISNQKEYYSLNTIYKKTCNVLENYNPNNDQSIASIFHIITATEDLQNKGVDPKELGAFAYRQPTNTSFFTQTPYQNPRYVSVFFERIKQHIAHMKKNNFTAPTAESFIQHKNNLADNAAIARAATFRVIITSHTTDPYNALTADAPISLTEGLRELERLINDIKTIEQTSLEEIERMANRIYNPKL